MVMRGKRYFKTCLTCQKAHVTRWGVYCKGKLLPRKFATKDSCGDWAPRGERRE